MGVCVFFIAICGVVVVSHKFCFVTRPVNVI